jgi:large subunit ribosomal protein L31
MAIHVERGMNKHPDLHLVEAVCSTCGTVHTVRTSAERVAVDTCSSCHPAYTGVERATASGSRIERFNRRRSLAAA